MLHRTLDLWAENAGHKSSHLLWSQHSELHSIVSQSTIVACARKQTVDVVLLYVVTLHNIKSSARIQNTDFGTKLPLLASKICHLVAALHCGRMLNLPISALFIHHMEIIIAPYKVVIGSSFCTVL